MTFPQPLAALTGIPIVIDDTVPVGLAEFDLDPAEPRHITRVRATSHRVMVFTAEQTEQIRDHYRAMDERAGRALAEWQELTARFGFQGDSRP